MRAGDRARREGRRVKRSHVARIEEARCIGCTRCIEACPVDAISGANGLMHAVIARWCIGCGLCLPPCPVDCIEMVAADLPWTSADAHAAQRRYRARKARIARRAGSPPAGDRKAVIAAILGRKPAP
jgi:RnfABCDGE-type electron transport complex B subunit